MNDVPLLLAVLVVTVFVVAVVRAPLPPGWRPLYGYCPTCDRETPHTRVGPGARRCLRCQTTLKDAS